MSDLNLDKRVAEGALAKQGCTIAHEMIGRSLQDQVAAIMNADNPQKGIHGWQPHKSLPGPDVDSKLQVDQKGTFFDTVLFYESFDPQQRKITYECTDFDKDGKQRHESGWEKF
jgi:hypothetical protein